MNGLGTRGSRWLGALGALADGQREEDDRGRGYGAHREWLGASPQRGRRVGGSVPRDEGFRHPAEPIMSARLTRSLHPGRHLA